jgi:cytochrome P450
LTTELWDPFETEHIEDPYPAYRRLRDEFPVYHNSTRDFWAVTRHADCMDVAQNWELFSNKGGVDLDATTATFIGEGDTLEADPPHHGQLRGLLGSWLDAKRFRSMAPLMRDHIGERLEILRDQPSFDVASELCWTLPRAVMEALMGFSPEVTKVADELVIQAFHRDSGSDKISPESKAAGFELRDLLRGLLEERRRAPKDDFLSIAANGRIDGKPVTEEAAVGMSFLVWSAGLETTASLLSNIFYYLGRDPAARAKVVENPKLAPRVVEEVLRFDGPIQNIMRTTTKPLTLHGVDVPADARIVMVFGSANRDERVFDDPDTLSFDRPGGGHLAFGEGIHACIGAPAARLEARLVTELFIPELGDYEIGSYERIVKQNVRGFSALTLNR